MIQVKDVSFSYGTKPFIENISFNVGKGEIFGFLGPSGAGKSTLQKIQTGCNTCSVFCLHFG
jgi:fluoroquinolone transport system ATP-binding protein